MALRLTPSIHVPPIQLSMLCETPWFEARARHAVYQPRRAARNCYQLRYGDRTRVLVGRCWLVGPLGDAD